jgi:hypothetical protein
MSHYLLCVGAYRVQKELATLLISGVLLQPATADDFSGEPFLLRLALSIDRASNYADTAARLASAAYPGGSADNPAGDGFPTARVDAQGTPVTFTTINAFSESGAWISAAAVTSTFHTIDHGVWSAEYHYTKTIDSDNQEGLTSDLRAQEFVLGWSQALSEDLSVGIRGRLVPAKIRHEARFIDVGMQPLRHDTDQFGGDVWVGVMGRIADKVTAGAVIRLGWADTDNTIKNLVALGPIPPLTELSNFDDDTQIRGLKFGLGYQASSELQMYTDVQYLRVHSNAGGALEVGRFSGGAEVKISPKVTGIFGGVYDTESELTLGVGLALRPAKSAKLHITYQHNGAPEIDREFGNVNYVNASLAVQF